MPLTFRNIDVSPDATVETWPFEGVLTALERGGLHDWRRLATAIEQDPWGPLARKVEQAVTVAHPYGVGELMTDVIARARADADRRERLEVTTEIRRLVAGSGLTHAEFAVRIGTSASRFSTYVTGRVVPSATLMVRMRLVAALVRGGDLLGARHPGPSAEGDLAPGMARPEPAGRRPR